MSVGLSAGGESSVDKRVLNAIAILLTVAFIVATGFDIASPRYTINGQFYTLMLVLVGGAFGASTGITISRKNGHKGSDSKNGR